MSTHDMIPATNANTTSTSPTSLDLDTDARLRAHGLRIHGRPASGPVTWTRAKSNPGRVLTQAEAILACDRDDEEIATNGYAALLDSAASYVASEPTDSPPPPFKPRKPKRRY